MKPKISIIMPVYNGEKFLLKAINSVLKQSFEDFELLIINDGSNDDSEKIITFVDDIRIKYFYKKNGGEASARNFGLEKSIGEYITFLDADDLIRQDRLERQYDFFEKNNVDAIYTDVEVINEFDEVIYKLESEEVVRNYNDFFPLMINRQIIPATATLMLKRKIIDNGVRYPEEYNNSVDYLFSLRIAKDYKLGYLNEVLYYYRRHKNNLTNNHKEQLKTEKLIVKNLSDNVIKDAIRKSSLSDKNKNILLAKIYNKIDNFFEAIKILERVKEKDEITYFYLGNLYFEIKEYEIAKKYYLKAKKNNEKMSEIYNNLGVLESIQGNEESAKKLFNKAIILNNDYIDPKFNLENKEKKITKKELRKVLTKY